jgi:glutamate synthase domain-containing protein 3
LSKKLKLEKLAFKKKQIEEEKQKKLEEKMKAKEDAKLAKDNAKKAKEELKEINKKAKNENVVLSIMCCTQILKKGGTCKQKQHTGTLCLRHHNITIALTAN